jgi:phosphatidylinositol alpha-1,6-mannosyltransferase
MTAPTPPCRIAIVANNFPPIRGGSAVVYANLARCASGRIEIIAPTRDYTNGLPIIGWREHDRRAPYRVKRLPLLRTVMWTNRPKILGRLIFLAADLTIRARLTASLFRMVLRDGVRTVCVGELAASGWLLWLFRFIPAVTTVVYVHGEEITTEGGHSRGRQAARRALALADHIVVVSRFTRDAVLRWLADPTAARRITLIENGVDNTRFTPAPKADDLLSLYQLQDCFVFVSVCRLVEKKGIDHTIRALARLVTNCPECRLLIVGAGPYRATLEQIAAGEHVADKVIFAGQVAEDTLTDHYRLGDVFIMPNREMPDGDTEGFGLVFLEANACGLPVIAGRDGGSPDAVRDGVNGLVVDGKSIEAIAAAMLKLRRDDSLRDRLRTQGLAVAQSAGWPARTATFLTLCGIPPTPDLSP